MTVYTVNHLPAATHGETARCLFAIELSNQSWVIRFITPLSAKINRRILSGGDWRGLLELIEEMRARVSIVPSPLLAKAAGSLSDRLHRVTDPSPHKTGFSKFASPQTA